jgi:hypothetical protein
MSFFMLQKIASFSFFLSNEPGTDSAKFVQKEVFRDVIDNAEMKVLIYIKLHNGTVSQDFDGLLLTPAS